MSHRYGSAASLRDNAKGVLNGKYGVAIRATLVFLMTSYGISWVSTEVAALISNITGRAAMSGSGMIIAGAVIPNVITCVATVILGVLMFGVSLFYLKLGCNHYPAVSDLFWGFKENLSRNLVVSLVVEGIGAIAATPAYIIGEIRLMNMSIEDAMIIAIAALVGMVVSIFVSISFRMTYFILADFPEYSAKEALSACWNKMRGHKWRYFVFRLSFIPYVILGVLSFGIGLIWLYPFMHEADAQFYLDLVNRSQDK